MFQLREEDRRKAAVEGVKVSALRQFVTMSTWAGSVACLYCHFKVLFGNI